MDVINELLKFVATSLVGGTVDMVLVWLLSGYVFSGYWGKVVVTPMISFECSVIVGFTFCWLFVWNDRVDKCDRLSFWKSLGAFNLSNKVNCKIIFHLLLLLSLPLRSSLAYTSTLMSGSASVLLSCCGQV